MTLSRGGLKNSIIREVGGCVERTGDGRSPGFSVRPFYLLSAPSHVPTASCELRAASECNLERIFEKNICLYIFSKNVLLLLQKF